MLFQPMKRGQNKIVEVLTLLFDNAIQIMQV